MKFFADEMLGKLARWLRMSGHDVSYERSIEDQQLLNSSRQEGRITLTRDTRLIKTLKEDEFLFISHNYLEDQIREVYQQYPELLKDQAPLSRCVECNTVLESVDKEKIKDKLWPFVYQTQENFTFCPSCNRIYWRATHVKQIQNRLERIKNLSKNP